MEDELPQIRVDQKVLARRNSFGKKISFKYLEIYSPKGDLLFSKLETGRYPDIYEFDEIVKNLKED